MYDSIKKTCNNGITFANMQIKYNQERDYYLGIRNAYTVILRQLLRNEQYIKQKSR